MTAPPEISPQTVIEYARRRPSNREATASLVWGLLLFVPFISGICAIVFGRRGMRAAAEVGEGRGRARAGLVLGWINIGLSMMLLVSLPPALIRARHAADQVQGMSQLRQIPLAMQMY